MVMRMCVPGLPRLVPLGNRPAAAAAAAVYRLADARRAAAVFGLADARRVAGAAVAAAAGGAVVLVLVDAEPRHPRHVSRSAEYRGVVAHRGRPNGPRLRGATGTEAKPQVAHVARERRDPSPLACRQLRPGAKVVVPWGVPWGIVAVVVVAVVAEVTHGADEDGDRGAVGAEEVAAAVAPSRSGLERRRFSRRRVECVELEVPPPVQQRQSSQQGALNLLLHREPMCSFHAIVVVVVALLSVSSHALRLTSLAIRNRPLRAYPRAAGPRSATSSQRPSSSSSAASCAITLAAAADQQGRADLHPRVVELNAVLEQNPLRFVLTTQVLLDLLCVIYYRYMHCDPTRHRLRVVSVSFQPDRSSTRCCVRRSSVHAW